MNKHPMMTRSKKTLLPIDELPPINIPDNPPPTDDIEEDEMRFSDYVAIDRDEKNFKKHMKLAKRISKE